MVNIISLGLGVQSTALYLMSSLGELPRADYAIFSDLGRESSGTYRYLEFLKDWQKKFNGIPIIICRTNNLFLDLLKLPLSEERFVSIPAFTRNPDGTVGMLRRQCTYEYKIRVVDDCIRDQIYQLPKGSRRPLTAVWHGITMDEIERMSIPQEAWKLNTYPFLGYTSQKNANAERLSWRKPMTRKEVVQWYLNKDIPLPQKSSCVFCPYQSDQSWAWKKEHAPEDFQAAIDVDNAIRDCTRHGVRNPVYLHRSCKPLSEVTFNPKQDEEWGECSGNCHL